MSKSTADCQRPTRILALCDTIAVRPGQSMTGFARVAMNLFSRWEPAVAAIDIWAIGFDGYGYKAVADDHPNWTLIPAGNQGWNSPERLTAFLRQLENGNYTHVFMLMDPDALSAIRIKIRWEPLFSEHLRSICRSKNIRSILYYPVDAPLRPPYDIIKTVDVAVTYTEYGRKETQKALGQSLRPIEVIPHGVDHHFKPVTEEDRVKARNQFQVMDENGKSQVPFLKPGDLMILNVNKNEWRKDPLRSLEILKGLRDAGVPAKMIFRMNPTSVMGGVHLERAAEQLGLKLDRDWAHIGPVPEKHLRDLYGAADLYLTTSLGEGWGLGVTEALACGTPVAIPGHTSLLEIGAKIINAFKMPELSHPIIGFLKIENDYICGGDTHLRRRVCVESAVIEISEIFGARRYARVKLPEEIVDRHIGWLSWDRIAMEFLRLMNISQCDRPKHSDLRVELIISVQDKQTKKNIMNTNVNAKITTLQQVTVQALFKNGAGVVPINGVPTWVSADTNIATVTPADDGLSAVIVSVAPGMTTVTVSGEGDPTPGVDTQVNMVDVTVVNPEATELDLVVGTPTDKPAPAAAAGQ